MPKWTNDAAMDAELDYIAAATALHVCSTLDATPTRAEVLAASLANVAVDAGDFTKADGVTSGRRVTVAAQNGVAVTANGTPSHIALIDGTNVRDVTTCTGPDLTSGSTVDVPAWSHTIPDPA